MDTKQYADEWAAESRLLAGMAFLAENPEAYGLVPDACPAVTSDLLLAVNGHGATGGELSPTYPVEEGGVDGLLDNLYGNLIPRTDENTIGAPLHSTELVRDRKLLKPKHRTYILSPEIPRPNSE